MNHLTIASFKYGVDTRRSELTSSPGTLVKCENGHINQGGQIEKRKAFTLVGQLPRIANGKTIDAFGLQEAGNTLYTFGSADPTGVAMPPGVTYRRVRHYITTYNGTVGGPVFSLSPEPAITGVIHSCAFGGNDFVTVSFGAGVATGPSPVPSSSMSFYAGNVILPQVIGEQWFTGGINGGYFNTQFYTGFPSYLPGYTCTYRGGLQGYGIDNVTGPAINQPFTVVTSQSTGGGTLASTLITTAQAGTAPLSASFSFFLTAGSSGTISVVNSNTGDVLLSGGAVSFNTSLLITAQAVATAINTGTFGYNVAGSANGYFAVASLVNAGGKAAQVTVTCPAAQGILQNGSAAVVTSTGTIKVAATSSATGAVGTINPVSAGGADQVLATPQTSSIDFNIAASWPANSWYLVNIVANNLTFSIGHGNIGGKVPTFGLPLSRKLYLAIGNQYNFSKLDDATRWEQQDTGAGFVQITDLYSSPVGVVSFASYQGRLAVFGRRNIQIWGISADPSQYQQLQSLQNIGTFAPLSVQSLGDLDVLFLSDTGIRSLRVRDSSLNAFSTDIGSAVDDFVIADLQAGGDNTLCCGIVEPTSNRYWLYTKGRIFVLSYFPTLKIQAWSTYLPTYDDGTGNQVTFTPRKFLVFQGQVYCLAEDGKIFLYGGANNNTYDGCVCTAELPWLDNKTPFFMKQSERVNIAMSGRWQIELGMDPRANTETQVVVPYELSQPTSPDEQVDSTFNEGSFAFSQKGTHFKFLAYTDPTWQQIATLSAVTLQYMNAEEA